MPIHEKTIDSQHGALVAAMGGSYALGTFADNFFKQCLVLMAAYIGASSAYPLGAGGEDAQHTARIIQSVATVLYSLPFVVCSAWAGWLADRCVKKHIVLCAKLTEFLSLIVGAYALVTGWWVGMLLVVFCMGLQSTFFSPALNGTIPELFTLHMVPRVNSYIKLASTVAILLGIGSAGVILEWQPSFATDLPYEFGRLASGAFIIGISFLGVLVSLGIKKHPIQLKAAQEPFPWAGPWRSFKHFWEYRKDRELFLVFWAEGVFYAVSVIIVICIVNLSSELGYSLSRSSYLTASIMVGIAIGAIIAGRFDVYSWRRFAVPGAIGMGGMIALTACVPFIDPVPFLGFSDIRLASFFGIVFSAGVCGGIYLIPIASFIQAHPPANEKGKALGVSNFFSYVAMVVSAPLFYGLGFLGSVRVVFLVYGLFTVAFALFVLIPGIKKYCGTNLQHKGNSIAGELLKGVLSIRYRVTETGLSAIPIECDDNRPFLFLPNHSALIDPVIVYSRIFNIFPKVLVDSSRLPKSAVFIKRLFGLIEIADIGKDGCRGIESVRRGLDEVVDTLRHGESVMVYPSGRLTLDGHEWIGGNSAVEYILKAVPDVRVILVRQTGLWGSIFSFASEGIPRFMRTLIKMIPRLLANGIFFMPKRKVTVEFIEATDFPRHGSRREINTYLENFYEEKYQEASLIPYYFWRGSVPFWVNRALRVEREEEQNMVPLRIDETTRKYIVALIAQKNQFAGEVTDSMHLGRDLGLDSLDMMELSFRMETEFGCHIANLDYIATVKDFLGAVVGISRDKASRTLVPDRRWFSPGARAEEERFVSVPRGKNLVEAFIEHVGKHGSMPFIADTSQMLTRAEVFAKALTLKDAFMQIPQERVGILLPSSITSMVTWLGLQLAGKVPVYLNWTVGEESAREAIESAGLSHIITSQEAYDRIIYKYGDVSQSTIQLFNVDDILKKMGFFRRMRAVLRTKLLQYGGYGSESLASLVPTTAVILFTSGSEGAPKGVPLTHENITTNVEDIRKLLRFKQRTRILAMLPPYHSFGFMLSIGLPCGLGLACVCHANPKESFTIAALIKAYCPTLLGGTPSFIEPLLAYGADYLYSIEHAFIGGEMCSQSLREEFSVICPQAVLCEGYGITESSPAISINPPDATKPGTIGKPLESIVTAIVPVEGSLARVPVGTAGQLLIRGASVFTGYLDSRFDKESFIEFEGERWFTTGDLVLEDEDGYLLYRGRLSRFVKRGGEMISLPLIEKIVGEALKKQYPAEGGEFFVALPRTKGEKEPTLTGVTTLDITVKDVNDILHGVGLPVLYSVKELCHVSNIPLLGNGKVDFVALHTLLDSEES